MTIRDVLTLEEIQSVTKQIHDGVPYNQIREPFKCFERIEVSIFFEFFKKIRDGETAEVGHRDEPYQEGENFDLPQYTWQKLSREEKTFFKENDKRLRKTQSILFNKKSDEQS